MQLATNRKFNFSKMIFEHMVSNISSPHKFLMYPRFIQICLDMQRHQFQQHTRTYHVPSLTMKVFSNIKRPTKGFSGQEVALFPTMLAVPTPSTLPSRITSSPTPSPEPTPAHTPSPTQPSPTQPSPLHPSPAVEHHVPTPHDSPLHAVHSHRSDEGSLTLQELMNLVTTLSDRIGALEDDLMKTKKTYSSAYTKLILRVKKLEAQINIGKSRRQARVVLSDDEVFIDDSSKQGRKLSSAEKASDEVSTAGAKKGIATEEVPIVSTAEMNISTAGGTVTYVRRSAEKRSRQDKGKAIMIQEEPKKKSKKELEQERLSYAKAIRLEEQMNEEQRAQIARDEEIARQWDEEERKRAMAESKSAKKIDWNDPSVIRYHTLKMKPKTVAQARKNLIKYLKNQGNFKISDFKGMSYNDIRPIFEKVWDFNQNIEPMEHEIVTMKSLEKSLEKMKYDEKMEEDDVVKEPGAKRKKSIPRKSTRKRQMMEGDAEKEELKGFLDIIPREEVPIEVESISTKFLIVDWKTYILTETFMYYQVFRGDGSSKNYKVLSEMLEDFDRQDVEELYRLVKEKYSASRLEGFDLMLWGDLYVLFESDEEDEIWKSQHEYNLISWRLCDFCGIHILLMENGLAIHMLTEKKYPLSQEMISKMLKKKLEVDHESSHAIEHLSKSHNVIGIAPVAIIDRQLPFEYTVASRSTDVIMLSGRCLKEKLSGSNFNDWFCSAKMVLRVEKKLSVIVQPISYAPTADSKYLCSGMRYVMLIMRLLVLCLEEEGKLVGPYVIKMKNYVVQLERLGYVLLQDLSVGLILNGLTSDFAGFAATPQVMAIQGGRIYKSNKKSLNAKVKGKRKGKGKDKSYIPKPKNPKPSAKEHLAKDDTCQYCKELLHYLTDDYSRYDSMYLLKHKHEVFEMFKVFKNEVENQLGNTIKALRSDRGGKYISQEFKDYLKACGIVQQLTPPYTPQHNGVSERRNHTLLDMVRSMMNLTTLSLSFWDYALDFVVRILNMVPTMKVDKTPYELWYGKIPNLSYLKVWGCEALVKRDTPDKLQ
ncbi:retrotransposon protein, putative, ty1-copia subclass [Tanacetum coccineum]|uniref:Retrotransposon protein, putative, ty1-copia subclass n=1 Tax=Tanacetum coccineum TaxID=301880 RepID=A0ABQ5DVF9_9ASTR